MDLPTPTFRPTGDVPAADASVREATAVDASTVGAVQAAAWRASYADVLPGQSLAALEPSALADVWRDAIVRPPSGGHRVLVALSGGELVGFVAVGPSEGGPVQLGEILALVVAPAAQRAGHGSRLLNAAADRLRQVGFDEVAVWVLATDAVRLQFLTGAGLAPDGAERRLDVGPGSQPIQELREIRLVASLAPPA